MNTFLQAQGGAESVGSSGVGKRGVRQEREGMSGMGRRGGKGAWSSRREREGDEITLAKRE